MFKEYKSKQFSIILQIQLQQLWYKIQFWYDHCNLFSGQEDYICYPQHGKKSQMPFFLKRTKLLSPFTAQINLTFSTSDKSSQTAETCVLESFKAYKVEIKAEKKQNISKDCVKIGIPWKKLSNI